MEGIDLKIARIRAGLKQYEMARRLGMTPVRLCRFELGRCVISADIAHRIKKVLDEAQSSKSKT